MIYIILGIIMIEMAIVSQANKLAKTVICAIGAMIAGTFSGMAIACSNGGGFSRESASVSYDYATYVGNDTYDTRNWGVIQVKVENPDKIPEEGKQVYLYRYYNEDEPMDLLIAPWKLFKERWYL